MTHIPISYDIPIYILLILSVYTIYELKRSMDQLGKSPISVSYKWLIFACIFIILWGVFHAYQDLFIPVENLNLQAIFHFLFSHGFLVAAVLCIAIAAKKTQRFVYSWSEQK